MKSFWDKVQLTRTVFVAHAEAFQTMLYKAEDGRKAWIWNSRDGVTPFCCWIGEPGKLGDGNEFRHAMGAYRPIYSAVLPDAASHVWVSHTPETWRTAGVTAYTKERKRPIPEGWEGPSFAETFPTLDDFLIKRPFEHGKPRLITREEFIASTPEWMGEP